jgi:replication-associated recombination protein RarA
MPFFIPTTDNGYKRDEAISALQKCIRRGMEDEAVFFAVELDKSGWGKYAFKRLRMICSEDVGLAWPEGPAVIRALSDSHAEAMKAVTKADPHPEYHGAWLFLVHAVLLLVRAPKSRLVDWTVIYHYNQTDYRPAVPDFALDKHTDAGRRKGRRKEAGMRHFFDVGSVLEDADLQVREVLMRERAAVIALHQLTFDDDDGDDGQLTLE